MRMSSGDFLYSMESTRFEKVYLLHFGIPIAVHKASFKGITHQLGFESSTLSDL